jgi:hypothetical protein
MSNKLTKLTPEEKLNAVSQALGMEIQDAYSAYRFLKKHPQFIRYERIAITEREAEHFRSRRGAYRLVKDEGGNYWEECYKGGEVHAFDENLDIYYTKTDAPGGHGHVNDDKSKNIYTECWLEIGQVDWGYSGEWEWKEEHKRCYPIPCHDYELDTGGTTFDEALINLANNVLKKYGPIPQNPERYVKK